MNSIDIEYFKSILSESLFVNESMKKHTTFGIGGKASCYCMPKNIMELKKIMKYAFEKKIKTSFIGSGSNLLISDRGFDGMIVSLKKTFKKLQISNNGTIIVESGVMLGTMVRKATNKGLEGLESLIGVPGTVGGALYMNAGAYNYEISNYLEAATLLDFTGMEKIYKKEDINFSYRSSTFPKDEILINAIFKYNIGGKKIILENKKNASAKRKKTQPLKYRSAGSVFKNPSKEFPAGYLIDQAGLKGIRIGGAEISEKHANFIINKENATSQDVISLIKKIKKEVLKKFNIELDLEIKLLGFKND